MLNVFFISMKGSYFFTLLAILVPVFTIYNKFKEDFYFYEKRQKVKIVSTFVLQQAIRGAASTLSSK